MASYVDCDFRNSNITSNFTNTESELQLVALSQDIQFSIPDSRTSNSSNDSVASTSLYMVQRLFRSWNYREPLKIVWCISPIYVADSNPFKVIEIIEFNRMMGVDFAYAYNLSADSIISKILLYYQEIDYFRIIPFRFNDFEALYLQEVAFHDCIMRTMGIFRFMINTDLDEIIVPQQFQCFKSLINHLLVNNKASAYFFLHVFFYTEIAFLKEYRSTHEIPDLINTTELISYYAICREDEIWEVGSRSKLIIESENIMSINPHYVYHFHPSASNFGYVMPKETAKLHHYRNSYSPTKSNGANIIIDCSAVKWSSQLFFNFIKR